MTSRPPALPARQALVSLYATVAAILREDEPAMHLMLADLDDAMQDILELLVTIALATLERLDTLVASDLIPGDEVEETAREILATAVRYGHSPKLSVHAAAARLVAVRRGDRARAVADVADSLKIGTAGELVLGACTLLAAIVAVSAERKGALPRFEAADLCIAASFAASC